MKSAFARIIPVVMTLSSVAVIAGGNDEVLGRWEATVETRRGPSQIVLEFTTTEDGLAGTFTARDGAEELEDVAYADGELTFTRHTESQGFPVALRYSATVDGDTMEVTASTPRGERRFTARRVRP